MSRTATTTKTVEAIFRYEEPDTSITAPQRSLFAKIPPRQFHEEKLPLHDYRTDPRLVRGFQGLTKHGFTLVDHEIDSSAWANEDAIRKTYMPSVEQLVKNLTGCKTAIVNNVGFRRKHVDKYRDPKFYHPVGGEMDKRVAALQSDRPLITPFEADKSLEPVRGLHVDFSTKGLVDTVRHSRADLAEAGAPALQALDAGKRPPRIAAYSVWRPIKRVTRDPLAVLNWTSPGDIARDFKSWDYRAPGFKGEYLLEGHMVSKPERSSDHEWYYVPEQMPNEVWVIGFADTESEYDEGVAAGCGHGSPVLPGTEGLEPRESIEAGVIAFW